MGCLRLEHIEKSSKLEVAHRKNSDVSKKLRRVFRPWQSPYNSMDGNPVNYTDVRGLSVSTKTGDETVENGDNLWSIAKKRGTTVAKIRELNGLDPEDDKKLQIGTVLKMPKATKTTTQKKEAIKAKQKSIKSRERKKNEVKVEEEKEKDVKKNELRKELVARDQKKQERLKKEKEEQTRSFIKKFSDKYMPNNSYISLSGSFFVGGGASETITIVKDSDGRLGISSTTGGGLGLETGVGFDFGMVSSQKLGTDTV